MRLTPAELLALTRLKLIQSRFPLGPDRGLDFALKLATEEKLTIEGLQITLVILEVMAGRLLKGLESRVKADLEAETNIGDVLVAVEVDYFQARIEAK